MVVAFDIDGTLMAMNLKGAWVPRHDIIQLFLAFQAQGCDMVIWSGGGISYAEQIRDRLGLKAEVVAKGALLPDLAVDDQKVQLGKVNMQVTPYMGELLDPGLSFSKELFAEPKA